MALSPPAPGASSRGGGAPTTRKTAQQVGFSIKQFVAQNHPYGLGIILGVGRVSHLDLCFIDYFDSVIIRFLRY